MGLFKKLLLLITLAVAGLAIYVGWFMEAPAVPELHDGWWADGPVTKKDLSVRPFKVAVTEAELTDLQSRLNRSNRLPESLVGSHFNYGIHSSAVQKIVAYWRTKFDWRKQEKRLNSFPQFKTNIEGLDIHFLRVKPQLTKQQTSSIKVLPLLMMHGFPGSVFEFYDVIPFLTKPQADMSFVFEVICPSLPGYGFSDASRKPGMGAVEVAQVMKKLMERLGHTQYYLQGGDWGSVIAEIMAIMYPQQVLGMHTNMPHVSKKITNLKTMVGAIWPGLVVNEDEQHKLYPISKVFGNILRETGYFHIQATKPDTIGVALSHSPVGLAAYILEKFAVWTNMSNLELDDGGLERKFSMDQLLTNVAIYWFSNSITSAMRLYAETMAKDSTNHAFAEIQIQVPVGLAESPQELFSPPSNFLAHKYTNIVSYTRLPAGGHFLAFEEPQLFVQDVRSAIAAMEKQRGKKRDS